MVTKYDATALITDVTLASVSGCWTTVDDKTILVLGQHAHRFGGTTDHFSSEIELVSNGNLSIPHLKFTGAISDPTMTKHNIIRWLHPETKAVVGAWERHNRAGNVQELLASIHGTNTQTARRTATAQAMMQVAAHVPSALDSLLNKPLQHESGSAPAHRIEPTKCGFCPHPKEYTSKQGLQAHYAQCAAYKAEKGPYVKGKQGRPSVK